MIAWLRQLCQVQSHPLPSFAITGSGCVPVMPKRCVHHSCKRIVTVVCWTDEIYSSPTFCLHSPPCIDEFHKSFISWLRIYTKCTGIVKLVSRMWRSMYFQCEKTSWCLSRKLFGMTAIEEQIGMLIFFVYLFKGSRLRVYIIYETCLLSFSWRIL